MWLGLAIIALILWLLGALVFKIVGGLIHILVVIAVVAFVLHFIRKRRV